MAIIIERVEDAGGDLLRVYGYDGGVLGRDGLPVLIVVDGWKSALQNYLAPADFAPDGARKPGVAPRVASAAERRAYATALLQAAADRLRSRPDITL